MGKITSFLVLNNSIYILTDAGEIFRAENVAGGLMLVKQKLVDESGGALTPGTSAPPA